MNYLIKKSINPFSVILPKKQTSLCIFSSPHSGNIFPSDFLSSSKLSINQLRQSEDAYIDKLFFQCIESGSPLIKFNYPRSFVDVNREPYELDKQMFEDSIPSFANFTSAKVALGLGTIPKIASNGNEIYKAPLSWKIAEDRIENFYFPYHAALKQLLVVTKSHFNSAILFDCHSMPSSNFNSNSRSINFGEADFIIGDGFGTTCLPSVINLVEDVLTNLGYSVARNIPYSGGFTTLNYGRPEENCHALQIEISRKLYMDEKSLLPNRNFLKLKRNLGFFLNTVSKKATGDLLQNLGNKSIAAE